MKNKVVIITGASSGIGKASAWAFAQAGAQVVLAARNLKKLNLVCKELQEAGFTALAVQADVGKEEDCQRLISEAVLVFQGVDVLINNAGISMRATLEKVEISVIRQLMEINFFGSVYCAKVYFLIY